MTHFVRPSLGLIGRVVAILLFATLVEFGMSTVLYERASQFSVRDDEGRRLAEHLVIARTQGLCVLGVVRSCKPTL